MLRPKSTLGYGKKRPRTRASTTEGIRPGALMETTEPRQGGGEVGRPVRVLNVTPGQFANEDWVEVTGTIYPIGREVIVDAGTGGVTEVARPDRPYLTP